VGEACGLLRWFPEPEEGVKIGCGDRVDAWCVFEYEDLVDDLVDLQGTGFGAYKQDPGSLF
jgi:hypothetical protein